MTRKVVGVHACREVIKVRPRAVTEVFLRREYERSQELNELAKWAKSKNIKINVRDDGFLEKIAFSHQGVCFHVSSAPELNWDSLKSDDPAIILALDEVTDPHNVGAIIRTAWLLGARAVFVPEMRAAGLSPAVCKVASGGAEHVPLIQVSNLASELKSLKDMGFWIYGLDDASSNNIWSLSLPEKVVWVIGAEDKGMRTPVARSCDDIVSIPVASKGASFNASVAAAMALFETTRQHLQIRQKPSK